MKPLHYFVLNSVLYHLQKLKQQFPSRGEKVRHLPHVQLRDCATEVLKINLRRTKCPIRIKLPEDRDYVLRAHGRKDVGIDVLPSTVQILGLRSRPA